ncbi:hypothetical protein FHS21_005023 [Phyllobacterium trifolii]|uniref:Uncharacterized protein n=1 Tax=Phyllobacterium trifolii TaxID=300193 RepID=A0A839UF57_9HYPH|nr:hypothetical protein [Phyllobacterium trifolii]
MICNRALSSLSVDGMGSLGLMTSSKLTTRSRSWPRYFVGNPVIVRSAKYVLRNGSAYWGFLVVGHTAS